MTLNYSQNLLLTSLYTSWISKKSLASKYCSYLAFIILSHNIHSFFTKSEKL